MRLTKAQIRLIDGCIHTQDYWMCRAGWNIGFVPENGRDRIVSDALKRKGAMLPCGTLTDAGRKAWRQAIERKRSA